MYSFDRLIDNRMVRNIFSLYEMEHSIFSHVEGLD